MSKNYILIISLLFVFSSCYNTKYICRTVDNIIESEKYSATGDKYLLQPYDYLYIKVQSTNDEINELYANISSTFAGGLQNNESNFFLTGYMINDSGYVFIPTIGNLMVKGKTIEQARQMIQQGIDDILTGAVVNVRLTSFNVTFLGEVNEQGRVPYYRERVNILEGIGTAGGISDYGDKKHVTIIRPLDSVYVIYKVDLTNKNIIETQNFYLHPNDVVYVPPKKTKDFILFVKDYSSMITLTTSILTTTLLIIELTRNK